MSNSDLNEKLKQRLSMKFDWSTHRRSIAGKEVIIHCHHYNSRIQNTIEGASLLDGKKIISSAAEAVFGAQLTELITAEDDLDTKWAAAEVLYGHLGYGRLDCSKVADGTVTQSSSHFVEGWNAGFPERAQPVCSFTEGYLQGAIHAVTGETVFVRERQCMASGASECLFEVDRSRSEPIRTYVKKQLSFTPREPEAPLPNNIDAKKIIGALVDMPIHGDDDGLIPAFGVYLANTPADFYNLINIEFVEQMAARDMIATARKLLVFDAETCGLNTFRGIMGSPEWEGLIAPMVKEEKDKLFGIVAVSNALGWGNWHVREQSDGESLHIESLNGYEALGFRELRGQASTPQCFMLTGVAAGIMGLVYGDGPVQDRLGMYSSTESECITNGREACAFHVHRVR